MINLVELKNLAKKIVNKEVETERDLITFLNIWWSKKYGLPGNHSLFWSRTLEEHMLDFYVEKVLNEDKTEVTEEQTLEELEEDEKWYKEKLGDEYREEYDYLLPPTPEELKKYDAQIQKVKEEQKNKEDEIEEDFDLGDKDGKE